MFYKTAVVGLYVSSRLTYGEMSVGYMDAGYRKDGMVYHSYSIVLAAVIVAVAIIISGSSNDNR